MVVAAVPGELLGWAQAPAGWLESAFPLRIGSPGVHVKVAGNGIIRVFDQSNGWFGSYAADGGVKTFFVPRKGFKHFQSQPGSPL